MKKKNLLLSIGLVVLAVAIAFLIKQSNEPKLANTNQYNQEVVNKEKEPQKSTETPEGGIVVKEEPTETPVVEEQTVAYKIYSNEDFEQVIAADKPTIIMFGTESCVYCRQMEPMLERLSEQYEDKVVLKYVDANNLMDVSSQYPIRGVPAFMYQLSSDKPFVPSEETRKLGFYAYSEEGSEDVDLVMSYGFVEEQQFTKFIEEMIANAK